LYGFLFWPFPTCPPCEQGEAGGEENGQTQSPPANKNRTNKISSKKVDLICNEAITVKLNYFPICIIPLKANFYRLDKTCPRN
jgi:hypothetical protein